MKKLFPILLYLLFTSCGGLKIVECPHLTHLNGDNVNIILDSIKTEVIINYSLHSLEHLNLEGMQPCRYRVSWIGEDGGNQIGLVQNKDIIQ
ncbi:hypothetical protein COB55_03695 [Candidatus Wolfebacteria bacterium]|nr:MAG: hypothetical protein COB55_03695 [Candidatus Wolfebacteria bacterium]